MNEKIIQGLMIGLALLTLACGAFFLYSMTPPPLPIPHGSLPPSAKPPISPMEAPTSTIPSAEPIVVEMYNPPETHILATLQDRVIYTEVANGIRDSERTWPVMGIFEKIGDAPAEKLFEVGKVGEYAYDVRISPDKKTILINLESKIQVFDLATKHLKDVFLAEGDVLGVVFSPDGKELFVWDQIYAGAGEGGLLESYILHRVNIATKEKLVLKTDTADESFSVDVWRDDNKILLTSTQGTQLYFFDLRTHEMRQTPDMDTEGVGWLMLSRSGNRAAFVTDFISDACNDMSGDAPSMYKMIEPVTGKSFGTFGLKDHRVYVMGFSPNDQEVLYSAEKPPLTQENGACDQEPSKTFYRKHLATGRTTSLTKVQADALKESWK